MSGAITFVSLGHAQGLHLFFLACPTEILRLLDVLLLPMQFVNFLTFLDSCVLILMRALDL